MQIHCGGGDGGCGKSPALGLLCPEELGVEVTPADVSSRGC